ncbi:hypothetical protein SELMODRAFT_425339 [Selaginella moellendorffii]|uniref:Nuclear pore complex protein n=1 Tax=Selaginella moellendorffii TaxID=88036 RepID=D8SSS7_SELML|nr:hypothetical protein SELMODRAFT_425339 [Selaginella moellendorffii]
MDKNLGDTGFASLPELLSEFEDICRDLAQAVRDEATTKHRAIEDRALLQSCALPFVWKRKQPRVYKNRCNCSNMPSSCLESLASKELDLEKKAIKKILELTLFDTDAPTREGLQLHPEDQKLEDSLLEDAWKLIRAGRKGEAQDPYILLPCLTLETYRQDILCNYCPRTATTKIFLDWKHNTQFRGYTAFPSWVESTVAAIQLWLRARQLAVESCIARATAQARNILRRRKHGTTAATNEELETGEEPQAIAGGLVAVEMDQAATAQSQAEVIPASPSQSQRALALLTSFLSLANAISMCQKWTQDGHDLALIATAICAASAFCFLHSFLVGLGHIEKQRRKGCMTILLTALIAFFYPFMGLACRRLKRKKGWATTAVYTVSAVVPFVMRVICLLLFTHEASTVIASACSLLSGVAWLIFSSIVEYQILHIVGACLAVAVQVIYFACAHCVEREGTINHALKEVKDNCSGNKASLDLDDRFSL